MRTRLRRLCPGLALVALTLVATAAPTAAPAASARACLDTSGEGITPQDITAAGVSCVRARRVASRASKVAQQPFDGCVRATSRLRLTVPCRKLGFSCRVTRRVGSRGFGIRVGCRRGTQRIAWTLG